MDTLPLYSSLQRLSCAKFIDMCVRMLTIIVDLRAPHLLPTPQVLPVRFTILSNVTLTARHEHAGPLTTEVGQKSRG
jgi:hypothetical protein